MHSGQCPWGLHLCQQDFISHKVQWALKALQDICLDLYCTHCDPSSDSADSLVPLVDSWFYVREKSFAFVLWKKKVMEKKHYAEFLDLSRYFVHYWFGERAFQTQMGTLEIPLTWVDTGYSNNLRVTVGLFSVWKLSPLRHSQTLFSVALYSIIPFIMVSDMGVVHLDPLV